MEWLILIFVLFCIFVAVAPRELTKALLACVWVLMAASAVGSTLYAIVKVF